VIFELEGRNFTIIKKIDLDKEKMLSLCSIIYFILQLFKVYSQQEGTNIPINIELFWTKIFTGYKRFRFSAVVKFHI